MENFSSDLLFIIIVLVGAAFLGYLIGYFVNARYKKVIADLEDLKKEMGDLKVRISDQAGHLEKHISEYGSLKSDLAGYKEKHKSEYDSLRSDLAGFKENHHSEHGSLRDDLAGYKEKHQSEYESLRNDLATEGGRIRELQKLASEVEELKKKIADHSHEDKIKS